MYTPGYVGLSNITLISKKVPGALNECQAMFLDLLAILEQQHGAMVADMAVGQKRDILFGSLDTVTWQKSRTGLSTYAARQSKYSKETAYSFSARKLFGKSELAISAIFSDDAVCGAKIEYALCKKLGSDGYCLTYAGTDN